MRPLLVPLCLAAFAGCVYGGDPLMEQPWPDDSHHVLRAIGATADGTVRVLLDSSGLGSLRESTTAGEWTFLGETLAQCLWFDEDGTPYAYEYGGTTLRRIGAEWVQMGDGVVWTPLHNPIQCLTSVVLPTGETVLGMYYGPRATDPAILLVVDGATTRALELPIAGLPTALDMMVDAEGQLWIVAGSAVDGPTVARWDGTAWTTVVSPQLSTREFARFAATADGSIVLTSSTGAIRRFEGEAWIQVPPPVEGPATTHCGVSPAGVLLCMSSLAGDRTTTVKRHEGGEWTQVQVLPLEFTGGYEPLAVTPDALVFSSTYFGRGYSYAVVERIAW